MKKVCAFLLLALLCVPSFAAGGDYRYEEAGLSLALPDGEDWVILTRDVQDGDEAAVFFEADAETLRQAMEQNQIQFEAVSRDRTREITIIISRDAQTRRTFNYNLLDEGELDEQGQKYVDRDFSEDSPGLDYLSCSQERAGDVLYLRFTGQVVNETTDSRFIQYATIYNGWMVNIAMHGFDGELTGADSETLAAVAASLRFDEALDKANDAQRYIDMAVLIGVVLLGALSLVLIYRNQKKKMKAAAAQGQSGETALSDSLPEPPAQDGDGVKPDGE